MNEYGVDEQGRTIGFTCSGRAGRFGQHLRVGQKVISEWTEREATIRKIYTHILTGPSGSANYVCVDLD